MADHDQLGDSIVFQSWRDELTAASGVGWRKAGIPCDRGSQRQESESECGRYDTFCRTDGVDGTYGVCDVSGYTKSDILKRKLLFI